MVCQNAQVVESPAEDIMDDEHSNIFVGAGHVGVQIGNLGLLPFGLAVPLEAGRATLGHDDESAQLG